MVSVTMGDLYREGIVADFRAGRAGLSGGSTKPICLGTARRGVRSQCNYINMKHELLRLLG